MKHLQIVFHSPEDEGYIAEAPELECCSAFGNSPEEALAELEQAMAAWLEVAKQTGRIAVKLNRNTASALSGLSKKDAPQEDSVPTVVEQRLLINA